MAALFGWIAPDGEHPDPTICRQAVASIAQRGAGPVRQFCREQAFVAALDHPFDLTAEHPPALVSDEVGVLAGDCWFDNYVECRRRFAAEPDEPRGHWLGRALARDPGQILPLLIGDYALAWWDRRRRVLLLARDALGTRPLYYSTGAGTIAFSSSIPALLALPWVSKDFDPARLARYLAYPGFQGGRPLFADIELVRPGRWLAWSANECREQRFWDWRDARSVRYRHNEDYPARARELIERAVADRLNCSCAVGSHLSGGLDSTAVSVLAQRSLQTSGRSLAAVYTWSPAPGKAFPLLDEGDERRVIEAAAAMLGVPVRYGPFAAERPIAALFRDGALEGLSNLSEEMPVMKAATEDGLGVMLSGWGGDEVISINDRGYWAWLLSHGHWLELLRGLRGVRLRSLSDGPNWASLVFERALMPHLPRRWQRARGGKALSNFELWAGVLQDYRNEILSTPPLPKCEMATPRAVQISLLESGHLAERMLTWAHWGAERGIHYRYPLLDRRLIEFCLGLPPRILRYGRRVRGLPHAALADCLPSGLKKLDRVNEDKRRRLRRRLLDELALALKLGVFDRPCPWIDLPALRAEIRAGAQDQDDQSIVQRVIRVNTIIRIYAIWSRYVAGEPSDLGAVLRSRPS